MTKNYTYTVASDNEIKVILRTKQSKLKTRIGYIFARGYGDYIYNLLNGQLKMKGKMKRKRE